MLQLLFTGGAFVAILEQVAHGGTAVRGATQNVQEHPVIHLETGSEWLRRSGYQSLVSAFVKGNIAVFGRFLFLEFLAGCFCLGFQF